MGLRNARDDPVTPTQNRCPRARVHGSAQDIIALVVPGGAGIEAMFDLMSLRAPALVDPVSLIESPVAQRRGGGGRPQG